MSGPQRASRQRSAVADALGQADRSHPAQELHDLVRRAGDSIGLTTGYVPHTLEVSGTCGTCAG